MKLKSLTIHNIASIEDACINFEGEVLRGDPLFLICGPTGAGKSTILDAICLALFGNTPRLLNVEKKAVFNDKYNSTKNKGQQDMSLMENNYLQVSNKGQLLRRGTGEGYAELLFENDEGTPYKARWAVARAHKRVDGKMQNAARMLQNLSTNYTVTKDVTEEVEALLGLTFEEFCRTTMLAQGEFTKFIQSTSKEKSDILEKLTGTEIYSEISKKIAELYSEKKSDYDKKKTLVEGIVLYSEEDKAARRQEIEEHQTAIGQLEQRVTVLTTRRDWLHDDTSLTESISVATESLQELNAKKQAEKYRSDEQLIGDYEATAQVREWLREIYAWKQAIEDLESQKDTLDADFGRLNGELSRLTERQESDTTLLASHQKTLDAQQEHAAMLENGDAIQVKFNNLLEDEKKLKTTHKKLSELEEKLPLLKENVEKCGEFLRLQKENVSKKDDELTAEKSAKEALKPTELSRSKEALHQRKNLSVRTSAAIKQLSDNKQAWDEVVRELQQKQERKNECEKAATLAAKVWEEAIRESNEANTIYEQWRDSLKNSFKMIRATLTRGQTCPLCQQEICAEHVEDPDYEKILKPVVERRDRAAEKLQAAVSDKNACSAKLLEINASLDNLKIKIKTAERTYKQQLSTANQLYRQLKGDELTDVENQDMNKVLDFIHSMEVDIDAELREIADKEKLVEKHQTAIDSLGKEKELLLTKQMEAQKALGDAEKKMATTTKMQEMQRTQLATVTNEINNAKELLRQEVTYLDWEQRWVDNPNAWLEHFAGNCRKYRETRQQCEALKQAVTMRSTLLDSVNDIKQSVLVLLPEFADNVKTDTRAKDNERTFLNRWQSYVAEVQKWHTTMKTKKNDVEKYEGMVSDFCLAHDDLPKERVMELYTVPAKTVSQLKNAHESLEKDIAMKAGALAKLHEQQEKHLSEKPEFEAEDTMESLEAEMLLKKQEKERHTQDIGRLKSELHEDEERALRSAAAMKQMEKSKAVMEKWKKFDDLFGSTDGTKFSRIAQSFILGYLLEGANHYLRQFTDRYELVCNPGSLILLVRDRYINQSPQFIKILSGGESFMVSLSLALALSRLKKRKANVNVLFIDEGFGSLDEECLDSVMNTLEKLHQIGGQQVGIISHVESLKERVRTQIRVERIDPSKSKVTIVER